MRHEQLFHTAIDLFGVQSYMAGALQNPGMLKTQDDVKEVIQRLDKARVMKEESLRIWKVAAGNWAREVREAFIKGELSE